MLNSNSIMKLIQMSKSNYSNTVCIYLLETPVGRIICAANDSFLFVVIFEDSKNFEKTFQSLCDNLSCRFIEHKNEILINVEDELKAYFKGKLKKFTVPLKTFGSEFQKAVWSKLQELPYASTQTYCGLAKALGCTASHARAVGAACGANSHIVIIPCHRLVSTSSIGGFTNGVDRKKWLIEHEKKYADK